MLVEPLRAALDDFGENSVSRPSRFLLPTSFENNDVTIGADCLEKEPGGICVTLPNGVLLPTPFENNDATIGADCLEKETGGMYFNKNSLSSKFPRAI